MSTRLSDRVKVSQISALQIFQLIRYTTLILIGVVFSKSLLSTNEIGQYETVMFLAGAATFFWLNGLIQGFLPSFKSDENGRKSNVLFNVFYILLALAVLSSAFLFIFEQSISSLFLKGVGVPFLRYLLLYLVLSTPSGLIEYIYLVYDKGKAMLVYGFVSYGLMFLFVVVPPVLGYGIDGGLIGLIISSLFRFIWVVILLIRYSSASINLNFIRKHIIISAPLIFSMLLSGSGQYIDGLIIGSHFDEATFAVFRFGAREFPLVLLLANAFNSSMLPGFSDLTKLQTNLDLIRINSEKLANWLFPLSGVLMLLSHLLFPVIFNDSFSGSATIFNIYLLLIISRLLFPQTILTGMQRNNAILWASFLEIILNVGLSLWFLQLWGLPGVAYGTVCAYVFEKLILMGFVKKIYGFSVSEYLNVKQHLVYSLLLALEFIMIEYLIW